MKDTHKTLLIALLAHLEDVTDRIDVITRLLSKAMERNTPEVDACWYMSQDVANDLMSESNAIRKAMEQIDAEAITAEA